MDKIFGVYAASGDRYATLSLPAAPYELMDVLDKADVQDVSKLHVGIEEYHRFSKLEGVLESKLGLCELNALAERLSALDEAESAAFEGMLNMEINQDAIPIPLPRLIDLAYSTDRCHVLSEVKSDAALGRFYAENGFVQRTDELPDELFELLDFEKIGREMRQSDGGVYTSGGYVMQHSKTAQVYKDMDLTPKAPSYTVLLELSKGYFDDPQYDNEKTVLLSLPAESAAIDKVLDAIEA